MFETKVKIDGMACGMCESHINDAIRKAFDIKKVTSSHSKGESIILSEQTLDEATLKNVIGDTGYAVKLVTSSPYEKKGLFGFLKK
ncbi:heavy-metal-associated domain-containing protein [Konateibacter massiliensis]|uniref:heavy-metal-associated domain-containing protein n=1 Tax=Konateibacter massiliensis TaxID=2002841 RepID=UPI000C15D82B|nr:ATPase P [Konateibacter massiliensis]